jgi:natural product biosynthesis luciferase-like monooxygenase protein
LGAALAVVTEQIQIRAGSVVIPFQDPLRVAEEWSVIDNLSGGRVGIACASGWHTNDFVLAPTNYDERKQIMYERMETIQKLWRGETITLPNGSSKPTEVRIYPQPLQPSLPMWLASHGDATFIRAGELGVNLLTVLWDTSIEELSRKIRLYHKALAQHGHDPNRRKVTLMLHTFIGETMDIVREKVKTAYEEYLYINLGLQENQAQGLDRTVDLTPDDKECLVTQATEQLFQTRGLVGTPELCLEKIKVLQAIGVDEVACLIDFGVDFASTMDSLHKLSQVQDACNQTQFATVEMDEGWL